MDIDDLCVRLPPLGCLASFLLPVFTSFPWLLAALRCLSCLPFASCFNFPPLVIGLPWLLASLPCLSSLPFASCFHLPPLLFLFSPSFACSCFPPPSSLPFPFRDWPANTTQGLRNLLAAFQDQRVVLYGDPYSTKKTLFRFNRPVRRLFSVLNMRRHLSKWSVYFGSQWYNTQDNTPPVTNFQDGLMPGIIRKLRSP